VKWRIVQPYAPMLSANLEAVTIDAFGTLVHLRDPVPALRQALAERGAARTEEQVRRAFLTEAAYYVDRSHEGRDEATLALLRRDCAAVFLDAAEAELDPSEFAPAYVASLEFEAVDGAPEACRSLADAGLRLAVVSNWDVGLHACLAQLGLDALVGAVVTTAEAGAPKPAPAVYELALERLRTPPGRSVHVGDSPADEEGARAAGLRFEPAPLADAALRIHA
jgi:HAD superfamily hydrolase (TIGR01549 family)